MIGDAVMNKKYIAVFLLLFSSSIMLGLALKNTVDYAMLIAYGVGGLFLIGALYGALTQKEGKPKNKK